MSSGVQDKFVLESSFTSGKHSDAVWEVVWVDKGNERGETLVSVSSDGRVTQVHTHTHTHTCG